MSETTGGQSRFAEDLEKIVQERKLKEESDEGSRNLAEAIGLEAKYNIILQAFDEHKIGPIFFESLLSTFTEKQGLHGRDEWDIYAREHNTIDTKEDFIRLMLKIDTLHKDLDSANNVDSFAKKDWGKTLDDFAKYILDQVVVLIPEEKEVE